MILPTTWREIGDSILDQFIFIPAKGSGGGNAIGWNSVLLDGTLVPGGEFFLTMDFVAKKDKLRWRCTTVYGPIERLHKLAFWNELGRSKGDVGIPWVICGDFNAIFNVANKSIGNYNWEDIRRANDFMHELEM